MNYAVIDLGSNSIRMTVFAHDDGKTRKILNIKETVGLAGYVSKGVLGKDGVQRACDVVDSFRRTAAEFVDPANIRLFATASLRNVKNREEASLIIAEKTGLSPDILEGEEEAALGFAGVVPYLPADSGILIDIGGASTELVQFEDRKPVHLTSLPFGSLSLSVEFVSETLPRSGEMNKLKAGIQKRLARVEWAKGLKCPEMVGIGGTARAALKLSRAQFGLPPELKQVDAVKVKKLAKLVEGMEDEFLQTVHRVVPERLHTITPGITLLWQAMKAFDVETLTVCKFGVRDGYLSSRVLK
ncbi:MAG: phosphatase [Deltaproteobacteria bacterium]|jgi:exopolyphosphatase/guanosine-5'-triphosphate,3'-diphosphate pyrophosphatase|nr:phosphatase [Deltaproteobacteria bacterium]